MDIHATRQYMSRERKSIFEVPLRVTFYARVSTTREEQENSVENQIAYFTDLIKKNPNWTYVEGYYDRIRGESAANRTSFQRMIADGMNGKFDLILTKEVSRFARNTIDSLQYTRDLLNAGVAVRFENDNICTLDEDSELRLTIMSSIAADEVRKLSSRVQFGHKRSMENGHVLGNNRIFGYDKNAKNHGLIINEEEAKMIKMIFELYATGEHSGRTLERELYNAGYRNRNGNKIHHNTIFNIIQNPKYKGYFCANRTKVIDYRTQKTIELPEEEWIVYKDETGEIVPAIVSEELWDRCNKILLDRSGYIKTRSKSFKGNSPFAGKIYCKHHGAYWRTSYSNSVSQGQPIYQWICGEKRKNGAKCCNSFAIMEEELYTIACSLFKNIAVDLDGYINEFIKIYNESNSLNDVKNQIDGLRKKVKKAEDKQDKLLELYMDGIITKSDFERRNNIFNEDIESINEAISELNHQAKGFDDVLSNVRRIKSRIMQMYEDTETISRDHIEEFVTEFIDKIIVIPIDKNNMEIQVRLKTNDVLKCEYKKGGRDRNLNCCSGMIFKKMIPEQQFKTSRNSVRNIGHMIYLTYHVFVCVAL